MLAVTNRAVADLESATMRVRFFSGRRAEDIAADMPILPVTAPGLHPPGPAFVEAAAALGDSPPAPVAPRKLSAARRKTVRYDGAGVTALVRSALYQPGTHFPVRLGPPRDDDDNVRTYEFVPGMYRAGGEVYGPSPCRLMIVGKWLGRVESEDKRPWSGPGSEPLWRCWAAAGLPPIGPGLPVFMTNLVRFMPPPSFTRIPADWMADAMHLLEQEVAACRPEYILLLGADAVKAVLGARATVSAYRGMTAEYTLDCRAAAADPPDLYTGKVVVGDHPAAVAHDPDVEPQLLASLRFLARQMGYAAEAAAAPTDYRVIETEHDLKAAVDESVAASAAGGYVTFDCEWEGRHPTEPGAYLYTVQWSHAPGHARTVYLRRCGGAPNLSLPPEAVAAHLSRLFAAAPARGARLVGHFAKADLPWLHSVGVDLYPHYVGAADDPDADGTPDRLWGWQKSRFEGAFDTYVAAMSIEESTPRGLEYLTTAVLGLDRYDAPVRDWVEAYCKENKISKSKLKGYGNCPPEVLSGSGYTHRDAVDPGLLYLLYNGDPRTGTTGLLDADRYGNSCRQVFNTRMRAWAAVAELERYGLGTDVAAQGRLREIIASRRETLLSDLRKDAGWPDFNPARRVHRIEFLFGEAHLGPDDDRRPTGALSLYLEPYKATKTSGNGRLWEEALFRAARDGRKPSPAADKETLVALARLHPLAARLLDIDFLTTAMKIWFRAADEADAKDDEEDGDEADSGDAQETKGFRSYIHADGRIRTRIGLVETGRYSSSSPNLQNSGGSVDDWYDRIMKWGAYAPKGSPESKLKFKSRSIFRAEPGWYLVSADLKGAEIAAAAWSSGDKLLIEHARRATLNKKHPDWLDLHADLARTAFNLKMSLAEVKEHHDALRTAAKRTRFSHYYGASPDTIHRQVSLDNPSITIEQIVQLVEGHDKMYPDLTAYFARCRDRVLAVGWMCNGFGGFRRFRHTTDRELRAKQQREGQNWSCQGLVADTIAVALGNLWAELRALRMRSRIVLTVHDSIMVEAPPDEVKFVADTLLPKAMTADTPVVVTSLDGTPLNRGPYHFDVDVNVYTNWGVEAPRASWDPDFVPGA